ncbi:Uncharacterised protein [Mycobacteroides abscessus subsp. abscessus]|nr:Uncharacterised protein [Mycobacteroides abscessus subsp. abscessus]
MFALVLCMFERWFLAVVISGNWRIVLCGKAVPNWCGR